MCGIDSIYRLKFYRTQNEVHSSYEFDEFALKVLVVKYRISSNCVHCELNIKLVLCVTTVQYWVFVHDVHNLKIYGTGFVIEQVRSEGTKFRCLDPLDFNSTTVYL
jgi:hypothetical protein